MALTNASVRSGVGDGGSTRQVELTGASLVLPEAFSMSLSLAYCQCVTRTAPKKTSVLTVKNIVYTKKRVPPIVQIVVSLICNKKFIKMASQPSQEVQLLLAAERRATEKVSEARKRKAKLLKKAKEEAAADIEQFKAERQIVFNKHETDHMGSKDDVAKQIDRDTTQRLETMQTRMQTFRSHLLDALMSQVVEGVLNWTPPLSMVKV